MSRFSFAIDPNFVAQNRGRTEVARIVEPQLPLLSWTMLSAMTLAAIVIWVV